MIGIKRAIVDAVDRWKDQGHEYDFWIDIAFDEELGRGLELHIFVTNDDVFGSLYATKRLGDFDFPTTDTNRWANVTRYVRGAMRR